MLCCFSVELQDRKLNPRLMLVFTQLCAKIRTILVLLCRYTVLNCSPVYAFNDVGQSLNGAQINHYRTIEPEITNNISVIEYDCFCGRVLPGRNLCGLTPSCEGN